MQAEYWQSCLVAGSVPYIENSEVEESRLQQEAGSGRGILFGRLTDKRKHFEWQKVTEAVDSLCSELQTLDRIKKKSGLILNTSACEPQAGQKEPPRSKTDQRVAAYWYRGRYVISRITWCKSYFTPTILNLKCTKNSLFQK